MNQQKIADLIKDLRKKNNLTQKDFALKYNVTYQAVSKWENGKNLPDIALIRQICDDYNIDINSVLDVKVKNKHKKIYIILILIILIFILSIVFSNDNLSHKKVSSNCPDFDIKGSLVYNKNSSYLYISNIEYCGDIDSEIYDSISCILYESNGEKRIISKCNEMEDTSLSNYLSTLEFSIENFSKNCNKYENESLILELEFVKDGNITSHKIPLKLVEC